jgi:hydrogenase expression/formation protein HypD
MEVCGTHTAAIAQSGLRSLLPPQIRLVSGPGCPVCVTPSAYIDQLCDLAQQPGHLVLCFGDLIRVPGHRGSLGQAMARGGQVRMIYSPLDALEICRTHPEQTIVLAAVGFETTAPSYALLVKRALQASIGNLRLLTALRRMPPALDLLCSPESGIDGFLAPGHVSAIIGSRAYESYALTYCKPFVVAGFKAEDVLGAIARLVQLCRREMPARGVVENAYPAIVRPDGNQKAQAVLTEVFEYESAAWRGLGVLPESGYRLRGPYAAFDAGPAAAIEDEELPGCRCGELMLGKLEPEDCPLFGRTCRPENPVGPCMVSTEGACGIHFRYLANQAL